jgi:hypothetical protein
VLRRFKRRSLWDQRKGRVFVQVIALPVVRSFRPDQGEGDALLPLIGPERSPPDCNDQLSAGTRCEACRALEGMSEGALGTVTNLFRDRRDRFADLELSLSQYHAPSDQVIERRGADACGKALGER